MTNEPVLLSQDTQKPYTAKASYNQTAATFLSILTRFPPTGAANHWDDLLLFINDRGEASIATMTSICSDLPASKIEWRGRILALRVATARNHERVVDVGRLRADLGEGGSLATLIARVHQCLVIIDNDTDWIGKLNEDGKAAADDLCQALAGYLRDDMEVWTTKDWLIANGSDFNQVLESLQITAMSSDAEVAVAAAKIRAQAVNERIFLRDNVEIEFREIVFEAFVEQGVLRSDSPREDI